MTIREQMAQAIYTIAAKENDQFIDEFKVDVRKSRIWSELPDLPNKEYWRKQADHILAIIKEAGYVKPPVIISDVRPPMWLG